MGGGVFETDQPVLTATPSGYTAAEPLLSGGVYLLFSVGGMNTLFNILAGSTEKATLSGYFGIFQIEIRENSSSVSALINGFYVDDGGIQNYNKTISATYASLNGNTLKAYSGNGNCKVVKLAKGKLG